MKRWGIFLIIVLLLFWVEGTIAKKSSNFNAIFTKQYTPDEKAKIQKNFDASPQEYSQECGNLMLWQMYQKCPEFAKKFAQTPELNDGIDAKEAMAMEKIYQWIKNPTPEELDAMRAMILAGEGDKRPSIALRAMLKGLVDGYFKEGDNLFRNYQGIAEFVMPILNYMKGEEWDNYKYTRSWMTHPTLFHAYINHNYRKIRCPMSKSSSVYDVFVNKEGWCGELAKLGIDMLKPHGYNGKLYWDMNVPKTTTHPLERSGHTVAAYEEDGLMCIFVDWTPWRNIPHNCMDKNTFKKSYILRTEPLPGWSGW